MSSGVADSLKEQVLGAAHQLFMERGYEAVGMRDIAKAVGKQPVLDDVSARCQGIWSLYYVGYRQAVIHGGNAGDCLAAIKPSLRFYLDQGVQRSSMNSLHSEVPMRGVCTNGRP